MSAVEWAAKQEALTQMAEGILYGTSQVEPHIAELEIARAQVYATLASAAATRLLAETYDGHHS